jgi:hypothetical protein
MPPDPNGTRENLLGAWSRILAAAALSTVLAGCMLQPPTIEGPIAYPADVRTIGGYRIEIRNLFERKNGGGGDDAGAETAQEEPLGRQELRIVRGGQQMAKVEDVKVDYFGGALSDFDRSDRRNLVPAIGGSITGAGEPELAIESYSGGAHCCTTVHLFRLGVQRFQPLGSIAGGNFPVAFRQIDKDPALEAVTYDNAFAYWKASFADSVAPQVVLKFDPASERYRFASALMRTPAPNAAALKRNAQAIRRDPRWKQRGNSGDDIPPALWDEMLTLIYAGNGAAADELLRQAWPRDATSRAVFRHELIDCQLRRSIYWPDIAAMNRWPADPPGADCPA